MNKVAYQKAIKLLQEVSTKNGFLASAEDTSNYKRIWARDGVICGLAALASGDPILINTFKSTLETLAMYQHEIGTIPSNVLFSENEIEVSYGGLAGRVDAITWFIIGVCQYTHVTKDFLFLEKHEITLKKCFALLEAWEFNNKHLLYVPLSGNWADEYITDGYVLYDQLLRLWAIKAFNYFKHNSKLLEKEKKIKQQIEINFQPNQTEVKYHEKAYHEMVFHDYFPCSFSPSGYKFYFDALANSLAILLNIGADTTQLNILKYSETLASETVLGLLPAFWPPVLETDEHWNLLKNNCKYEFRNFPYEFHNGGSWPMVNGFFGLALLKKKEFTKAENILIKINYVNAIDNYSFYENFNTQNQNPNGVSYCSWSAAATILLHQSLFSNFKLLL